MWLDKNTVKSGDRYHCLYSTAGLRHMCLQSNAYLYGIELHFASTSPFCS